MKSFALFAVAMGLGVAALSSPAAAMSPYTGQFMDQCDEGDSMKLNECIQFVEGVVAGYRMGQTNGARDMLCGAVGNDATEWVHRVKHYYRKHTELNGENSAQFILEALREEWRC